MKPTDMEIGKIYAFCSFDWWVFRFAGIEDGTVLCRGSMCAAEMEYNGYSENLVGVGDVTDLRPATPDEIKHFHACEEYGKFIEFYDIPETYQIF